MSRRNDPQRDASLRTNKKTSEKELRIIGKRGECERRISAYTDRKLILVGEIDSRVA